MFMCPKFRTNPVHIKVYQMSYFHKFVEFSKLSLLYRQKLFAIAPTNHRFAEKNQLDGTLVLI